MGASKSNGGACMNDKAKLGKIRGGRARAEKLSPERRSEIASKAARIRHNPLLPKAEHAGVLRIANLEISCYVLEGGIRVLSQRGINDVFGIGQGGGPDRAQKMPRFVGLKALEPFLSNDLIARISSPLKYIPPHGGNPANGVPATVLPDIFNVWLNAREARSSNNTTPTGYCADSRNSHRRFCSRWNHCAH